MTKIKVKGLEVVVKNLNKKINKIEGTTAKGLLAAAIFIQGEAQEITPVEHDILLNSAFHSPPSRVGNKTLVRVGYTAGYAPFVHEMPESNNFTKTGTGPKFLEKAVFQNMRAILNIIRKRIKL